MPKERLVPERDLAALAKRCRKRAGKTRAQAARDMKVSQTSVFQAEEVPAQALAKLRVRMIKAYSDLEVTGPYFLVGKG